MASTTYLDPEMEARLASLKADVRFFLARHGYWSTMEIRHGLQGAYEEIKLFRAVIDNAMRDLSDPNPSVREEAERWFSPRNKDFLLICNLADLPPKVVYRFVLDKWNILRQPLQDREDKKRAGSLSNNRVE